MAEGTFKKVRDFMTRMPSDWKEKVDREKGMTDEEKKQWVLDNAPQPVMYPSAGAPVKTMRGNIRGYRRGSSAAEDSGVTKDSVDSYLRNISRGRDKPEHPAHISARNRTEELKKMLPEEVANRKWNSDSGFDIKDPSKYWDKPAQRKPLFDSRRHIQKTEETKTPSSPEPRKVYGTEDTARNLVEKRLQKIADDKEVTGRNFNKNTKPAEEAEEAPAKVRNAKSYDSLGVKIKTRNKTK
jgi:hypothetical protein